MAPSTPRIRSQAQTNKLKAVSRSPSSTRDHDEVGTNSTWLAPTWTWGDPEGAAASSRKVVQEAPQPETGSLAPDRIAAGLSISDSDAGGNHGGTAAAAGHRIAALLEYDGTEFAGWQSQAMRWGLQDAVEEALAFVAGARVSAICADAPTPEYMPSAQVIHFDTEAARTARAWILGTTPACRRPSRCNGRERLLRTFMPGNSAVRRTYRYLHPELECALRVAAAAQRLDPASSRCRCHAPRRSGADRRTRLLVVPLGRVSIEVLEASGGANRGAPRRRLGVDADYGERYLHHMVRNIVGTLVEAQRQTDPEGSMRHILESRDRRSQARPAPASGLYLWRSGVSARVRILHRLRPFC